MYEVTSKKKKKKLSAFLEEPFTEGDLISVYGLLLDLNENKVFTCRIVSIADDKLTIRSTDNIFRDHTIKKSDVLSRWTRHIGADPFEKNTNKTRMVQFSLDSIIHTLDLLGERRLKKIDRINDIEVSECNWDPFVYAEDGSKERYQRPFVWTVPQKRALISSIYNGIDCGKIIIRQRSYESLVSLAEKGETELSYHDIVDGKQRLKTVQQFMLGEFKDEYGNHYGDLSSNAQSQFTSHQLFSYGIMESDPTDAEVLRQFLKLNFSGIPQSPKHMKFIKELYQKANR